MSVSCRRMKTRMIAIVSAVALIFVTLATIALVPEPSPAAASGGGVQPAAMFNANAAGQDWANSYLLAWLSRNAYLSSLDNTVDPPSPTTEDNFEERFAAWATSLGFANPDYVTFSFNVEPIGEVSLFDTEFVKVETADAIIFAFRGTETDFGDWNNAQDALVDLAAVPWGGMHWGFANAAAIALPSIRSAIAAAPGKKVWLTGHSLGGALAEATAWFLQSGAPDPFHDQASTPIDVQGVANYGAPRVFLESRLVSIWPDIVVAGDMVGPYNATFASRPTQRWVNNADVVPLVPPGIPLALPYKHIGQLNQIGVDGAACTVNLNATEQPPFEDFGPAWDAFWAAVWAWDWAAAAVAFVEMGRAIAEDASVDDHSMDRYASRIYWHLPAAVKANVPLPPYPSVELRQTVCDGPDTTPPVITVNRTGNSLYNDWWRSDVTVAWTVTDPETGILSSSGCATSVVTADTTGVTFTCTATSGGGTTTLSTTVKRDTTPPAVAAVPARAPNAAGWYNAPLSIEWVGTDATSGVNSCSSTTYSGPDAASVSRVGGCVDNAGIASAEVAFAFKYDATVPVLVAHGPDRAPDSNGWYNHAFTTTWTGTDALSGIESCTSTTYSGPDTASGSLPGSCTDNAGNTSPTTAFSFKYDGTAPSITLTSPPSPAADYLRGQTVYADYACTDAGSGAASCAGTVTDGSPIATGDFGSHTFTVAASDAAGNQAQVTHTYSVTYALDGFNEPVVNLPQINRLRAGAKLPLKWNLTDASGNPLVNQPTLFQAGWSGAFACAGGSATSIIESSDTAGESGLRWDADSGQYVFIAASTRGDAGLCRFLVLDAGAGRRASVLVQFV